MNAKKILSVLGLASVLGSQACSSWDPDSTARVFIDTSTLSESQVGAVHDAAHEWEEALDGYVTFEFVNNKGGDDLITVRGVNHLVIAKEYHYGRIANTVVIPWKDGGDIEISNDLGSAKFHRAILHEMGHALGLGHTEKGTIMAPDVKYEPDHVTCADVRQFCAKNGCDADTMTICQFKPTQKAG